MGAEPHAGKARATNGPPGNGFSREERVRRRADFVAIQSQPDGRVRSRSFVLLFATRGDELPRLGIVASKKVGNAVVRNRAKRVLREVFRLGKDAIPRGVDLVVIASQGLTALPKAELEREWRQAIEEVRRRVAKGRRALARRP